jgi:hypothetical protein
VAQQGALVATGALASGGATAGINPVKVGGEYNSTPVTVTTGQQYALQLDANGYLKVNTAAGAAAGGTSSTFSAALPATGTAIGFKSASGSLMQAGQVDASGYLQVNVAAGATQSVVDNSTGWASGTSQGLPIMGFYATSPTALTSGDWGAPLLAKTRQQRVVIDADSSANGGLTMVSAVCPTTPVATAIKSSAGQISFIHASNTTAVMAYIKFFNVASGSVTLTSTAPLFQIGVPGNTQGAGEIIALPIPAQFTTAMSYAVTSGIALLDNTALSSATAVTLTLGYV